MGTIVWKEAASVGRGHGRLKMIRGAGALLAIALLTPLVACGGSDKAVDADGRPVVEILFVKRQDTEPIEKMGWIKEIEKKCGCNIKVTESKDTTWNDKKNSVLGSQDLSDISIRAFGLSDVAQNKDQFVNLGDHLDAMPNVKELFRQYPDARKNSENLQGELYTLPSARRLPGSETYVQSGHHLYINKQWLDKLGLKVPTTWDELYQVLLAFKEKDPNGNGKADEIPFAMKKLESGALGWYSPFVLLNSTGMATQLSGGIGNQGLFVEGGKVGSILTDPRFKDLIGFLNKCYKAGLIAKDAMTQDDSKYEASLQGDGQAALVGFAVAWDSTSFGTNVQKQYESIAAPRSKEGVKPTWDYAPQSFITGRAALAESAKNKDAAYKVLNAMYDERISVEQLFGDIPKYTEETGQHKYSQKEVKTDINYTPFLDDNGLFWQRKDVEVKTHNAMDFLSVEDKAQKPNYDNVDTNTMIMPSYVQLPDEDQATFANNTTAVFNYAVPVIAKWIAEGVSQADWETFTGQVGKLGADSNNRIWQKSYDTYKAKYKTF